MEPADFATTLKAFVRRHPTRGYGGMFRRWAFSEAEGGYGSWGDGAPMRVAAVGWLAPEEPEADRLAAAQAEASHNHPDAVAAAQAVARAILAFRRGATAAVAEVRLGVSTDVAEQARGDLTEDLSEVLVRFQRRVSGE